MKKAKVIKITKYRLVPADPPFPATEHFFMDVPKGAKGWMLVATSRLGSHATGPHHYPDAVGGGRPVVALKADRLEYKLVQVL